jgi:phenylacetyl-CoA:acceptor oxidoreductase subunit 1
MTRYVMTADLRRCVGCQTCTAACKEGNGTAPGVQWRKVLDLEFGEYPDVTRVFVPTGCQHCAEPPCMEVCPTTATGQRKDGIVTIDYDLCIGCGYCMAACPYDARFKVEKRDFAYGAGATASEEKRDFPEGVATKCTFCSKRIDAGLAKGLKPGVDPEATPLCVNSCISGALAFGDIEDPESPVAKLLAENRSFRMHEAEGTKPNFYYLWDKETL